MRLLLDTHAFLWWVSDSLRLPSAVHAAILDDDNDKLVSAVSAWEISTKYHLGKLPVAEGMVSNLSAIIALAGFDELPITVADAAISGSLPYHHRDPFDRMLIAQALAGELALVSNETVFDRYGVSRVW